MTIFYVKGDLEESAKLLGEQVKEESFDLNSKQSINSSDTSISILAHSNRANNLIDWGRETQEVDGQTPQKLAAMLAAQISAAQRSKIDSVNLLSCEAGLGGDKSFAAKLLVELQNLGFDNPALAMHAPIPPQDADSSLVLIEGSTHKGVTVEFVSYENEYSANVDRDISVLEKQVAAQNKKLSQRLPKTEREQEENTLDRLKTKLSEKETARKSDAKYKRTSFGAKSGNYKALLDQKQFTISAALPTDQNGLTAFIQQKITSVGAKKDEKSAAVINFLQSQINALKGKKIQPEQAQAMAALLANIDNAYLLTKDITKVTKLLGQLEGPASTILENNIKQAANELNQFEGRKGGFKSGQTNTITELFIQPFNKHQAKAEVATAPNTPDSSPVASRSSTPEVTTRKQTVNSSVQSVPKTRSWANIDQVAPAPSTPSTQGKPQAQAVVNPEGTHKQSMFDSVMSGLGSVVASAVGNSTQVAPAPSVATDEERDAVINMADTLTRVAGTLHLDDKEVSLVEECKGALEAAAKNQSITSDDLIKAANTAVGDFKTKVDNNTSIPDMVRGMLNKAIDGMNKVISGLGGKGFDKYVLSKDALINTVEEKPEAPKMKH